MISISNTPIQIMCLSLPANCDVPIAMRPLLRIYRYAYIATHNRYRYVPRTTRLLLRKSAIAMHLSLRAYRYASIVLCLSLHACMSDMTK